MAVVSRTEDYDTAWTLVMAAKRKRLTDNYFNKSTALMWFRENAMETEPGGKEIQEDVEFAGVTTQAFSGHDILDTGEPDIVTKAYFPWRYYAAPIVIAFDTEMESRMAANVKSVLEVRTGNAMKSIRNMVETALFSAQSGKGMLGVQDVIATTPTSGTVGGINRATYSWWRNQYDATDIAMSTATVTNIFNGFKYMNDMWGNCSDGADEPSVIFTTQANAVAYQNIIASTGYARLEMADKKKGWMAGKPVFNTAPVLYSRQCPTGGMYFINSDYLKFKVQEGVNFSKTPFKSPHNQLSKVAFIVLSCQLTTNNPRRLGVISDINYT